MKNIIDFFIFKNMNLLITSFEGKKKKTLLGYDF